MNKKNESRAQIIPESQPDGDDEGDEITREQADQTQQIIETGTVTPTKGKHTIHCLTIVGQVVVVGNVCK